MRVHTVLAAVLLAACGGGSVDHVDLKRATAVRECPGAFDPCAVDVVLQPGQVADVQADFTMVLDNPGTTSTYLHRWVELRGAPDPRLVLDYTMVPGHHIVYPFHIIRVVDASTTLSLASEAFPDDTSGTFVQDVRITVTIRP